jgi:hypothetical protein
MKNHTSTTKKTSNLSKTQKLKTSPPRPLKKHLDTKSSNFVKSSKILPTSTEEAPRHKKLKFCQKLKNSTPPALLSSKPIEATQPKKKTSVFLKSTKLPPTTQNKTKKLHLQSPLQQKKNPIHQKHTHTHIFLSLSRSIDRSLTLSKHWDPFDIITSIIIIIKGQEECLQSKGGKKTKRF